MSPCLECDSRSENPGHEKRWLWTRRAVQRLYRYVRILLGYNISRIWETIKKKKNRGIPKLLEAIQDSVVQVHGSSSRWAAVCLTESGLHYSSAIEPPICRWSRCCTSTRHGVQRHTHIGLSIYLTDPTAVNSEFSLVHVQHTTRSPMRYQTENGDRYLRRSQSFFL